MFFYCSDNSLGEDFQEIEEQIEIFTSINFDNDSLYMKKLDLSIAIYKFYHKKMIIHDNNQEIFTNIIRYGNKHFLINKKLKFNGLYTILINLLWYFTSSECNYKDSLFLIKQTLQQISYIQIVKDILEMINLILVEKILENYFYVIRTNSTTMSQADQDLLLKINNNTTDIFFEIAEHCTTLQEFNKALKNLKQPTSSIETQKILHTHFKVKLNQLKDKYKAKLKTYKEKKEEALLERRSYETSIVNNIQSIIDKDHKQIMRFTQKRNQRSIMRSILHFILCSGVLLLVSSYFS